MQTRESLSFSLFAQIARSNKVLKLFHAFLVTRRSFQIKMNNKHLMPKAFQSLICFASRKAMKIVKLSESIASDSFHS